MFVRLGLKTLTGTNTSLLWKFVNYGRTKFCNIGSSPYSQKSYKLIKAYQGQKHSSLFRTGASDEEKYYETCFFFSATLWANKLECFRSWHFFQVRLIFVGNVIKLPLEQDPVRCFPDLLSKTDYPDWKKYYSLIFIGVSDEKRSFISLSPGANVIKLFLSVIYEFL